MKFKLMILILIFLSVSAEAVKPVEKEVYISINGEKVLFKIEGKQSVIVIGQNVEVEMQFVEYKTFDNYGVTFQLPHKASAYIDEWLNGHSKKLK